MEVLHGMLQQPRLTTYPRTAVFALERRGNAIESALAWQFERRIVIRFRPRFVPDATEMGDLLPLAKVPYVAGSEAKSDTSEPDAEPAPAKPPDYEGIVKRQGFSLRVNYPEEYGWKGWVQYRMFGDDPPVPNNMSPGPFFAWRRLDARNFARGVDRKTPR